MKRRWERHERELRLNYHSNSMLQRSYNKHGSQQFVFKILQEVDKKEDLLIKEMEFIEFFNSLSTGFNLCVPGKFPESCKKPKKQKTTKSVFIICPKTLDVLHKAESVTEASKILKDQTTNISNACKKNAEGFSNVVKNHFVIYEKDYRSDLQVKEKDLTKSQACKDKMAENNAKSIKIYRYSLKGKLIETYLSKKKCSEACKIPTGRLKKLKEPNDCVLFENNYFTLSKDFPCEVINIV